MALSEQKLRDEVAQGFRQLWWVRALLHTERLPLGAVLRAAMNKQQGDELRGIPQTLVAFGPKAIILDDTAPECFDLLSLDGSGVIWTNVRRPGWLASRTIPVFTVKQFAAATQTLVDDLQFTEDEAFALTAILRAWIHSDQRKGAGNRPEDRLPVDSIDKV